MRQFTNPRKTPREIAKLANPGLVARLANSVHILEEAVKSGGDGSLPDTVPGDPEALRGLPPPPSTQPCRPSATSASPESARRTHRNQRDDERHRDTKPAQCADAGLNLPRENTQSSADPHSPKKRPSVSRHPPLLRTWLYLLLILSSPGRKVRTDAAPFSCTVSGHSSQGIRYSITPGDGSVDPLIRAVPTAHAALLRACKAKHAEQQKASGNQLLSERLLYPYRSGRNTLSLLDSDGPRDLQHVHESSLATSHVRHAVSLRA